MAQKGDKGLQKQICKRGHDRTLPGALTSTFSCKACNAGVQKNRRARFTADHHIKLANSARNRNYQRKYGITLTDYEEMYVKQRGKCVICNIFHDQLFVDHNHATDEVRELLCRNCNASLGLLAENVDSMKRMIEYVERHGTGSERETQAA